jgi:hypothetical protein
MAKGKFNASSGTAVEVTATQSAVGVGINTISGVALGVTSESGYSAVNISNNGLGSGVSTFASESAGLTATSDSGQGVFASSYSGTGLEAQSDFGTALDALSSRGTAVQAQSTDGVTATIVAYGNPNNSAAAFHNTTITLKPPRGFQINNFQAAEFIGNVSITGSFSVSGTKGFRIDHPLEPKRKWLHHAAVESDAMKNMYDGTVSLNSRGEAIIRLPKWFGALNEEFRYLLTAIGAPAPNLHVSREVHDNQFSIAGGNPKMKVSWQVTGIRKDAWANTYPFASEENKSKKERGYSICPTGRIGRAGLKALLSPSIYERVVARDQLEKDASVRKQRAATLLKREQKRRPKA